MKLTGKKHDVKGLEVVCSCGNSFYVSSCISIARCVKCSKEKDMAVLCKAYIDKTVEKK